MLARAEHTLAVWASQLAPQSFATVCAKIVPPASDDPEQRPQLHERFRIDAHLNDPANHPQRSVERAEPAAGADPWVKTVIRWRDLSPASTICSRPDLSVS